MTSIDSKSYFNSLLPIADSVSKPTEQTKPTDDQILEAAKKTFDYIKNKSRVSADDAITELREILSTAVSSEKTQSVLKAVMASAAELSKPTTTSTEMNLDQLKEIAKTLGTRDPKKNSILKNFQEKIANLDQKSLLELLQTSILVFDLLSEKQLSGMDEDILFEITLMRLAETSTPPDITTKKTISAIFVSLPEGALLTSINKIITYLNEETIHRLEAAIARDSNYLTLASEGNFKGIEMTWELLPKKILDRKDVQESYRTMIANALSNEDEAFALRNNLKALNSESISILTQIAPQTIYYTQPEMATATVSTLLNSGFKGIDLLRLLKKAPKEWSIEPYCKAFTQYIEKQLQPLDRDLHFCLEVLKRYDELKNAPQLNTVLPLSLAFILEYQIPSSKKIQQRLATGDGIELQDIRQKKLYVYKEQGSIHILTGKVLGEGAYKWATPLLIFQDLKKSPQEAVYLATKEGISLEKGKVFETQKKIFDIVGKHPNVVSCHNVRSITKDSLYHIGLQTEFCPSSIEAYIEKHGAPTDLQSLKDMLFLFKGHLSGLKALHDNNILHADCKPGNTLIGNDGKAKISDLDGAQILQTKDGKTALPEKLDSFTEQFVAPEINTNPEAINSVEKWLKTDMWSTGTILYQMLFDLASVATRAESSEVVYSEAFLLELQDQIKELADIASPAPFDKIKTIVCKDLLANLLQTDPSKRFTCGEALAKLDTIVSAIDKEITDT